MPFQPIDETIKFDHSPKFSNNLKSFIELVNFVISSIYKNISEIDLIDFKNTYHCSEKVLEWKIIDNSEFLIILNEISNYLH